MIAAETYTQLMSDPAHLGFEVTLTLIQDVLIGVVLWPLIKRLVRRHDRSTHKIDTKPSVSWSIEDRFDGPEVEEDDGAAP